MKTVRDLVVFSKHNVFDDPPFLRLDLITCRNLLIYFNAKLQNTVMNLFHYALNPTGVLFLGKSEALGNSDNLFQSIDNKAKLFKRRLLSSSDQAHSSRLFSFSSIPKQDLASNSRRSKTNHDFPDAVISALAPDSLLVNENMDVLRIYGDVQAYTQLSAGDASTNLSSLVRKEFRQELRALLYKVIRGGAQESVLPKKLNINGDIHNIKIVIRPLTLSSSPERLLLVSFEKAARITVSTLDQNEETDPVVAELEQELSATREHLQTVVEELETSNEELQSTNEELQSTNEELLTVYDELQLRSAELSVRQLKDDRLKLTQIKMDRHPHHLDQCARPLRREAEGVYLSVI